MESTGTGRVEGLDVVRAVLMLLGIVLHSSSWQEPRVLFVAITLVSHSFRMGAFFAISGFLAAVALQRRQPAQWFRRRMMRLGIPAAFGLLVICPFIGWVLSHGPADERWPAPLPYDWYHLWFLVALLFYTVVLYLVDRFDRRTAVLERAVSALCTGRSLSRILLLIGLGSLTAMFLGMSIVTATLPAAYFPSFSEFRNVLGYLPLALFGFALARSATLGRAAHDWRTPAAFVVVAATGYFLWFLVIAPQLPPEPRNLGSNLLALAGAAFCPPAVFLLLFRVALRIERISPLLSRFADASFTVYLMHLPFIAVLNTAFARIGWDPYLEFTITMALSGSASYAFHRHVVRRSAVLGLLLNGTPLARSVNEARDHVAVAAADLHLRAGAEHEEALAVGVGLDLLDEIEIDDGGTVHPLKPAGV